MRVLVVAALVCAAGAQANESTFLTFTRADTATAISIRHWCERSHVHPRARVRAQGVTGATDVVVDGKAFPIAGAGRTVVAFELRGLSPSSAYAYTLEDDGGAIEAGRFRTLPRRGPVRVAIGGDVDPGAEASALALRVREAGAQVLILGGDLAYENGDPAAAPLVDRFVAFLDEGARTSDGARIAVAAAIGNHEAHRLVDFGAEPRGLDAAPFFDALFLRTSGDVDRTAWRPLVLSDVATVLLLDTGHASPIADAQAVFIEGMLRARRTPLAFAVYHVPLYPSVRAPSDPQSAAARAAWEPLFSTWGLAAAFEHHDHGLKRTRPIAFDADDPTGVVYFGDGGFGKETRARRADLDLRYVTALKTGQVWIVDVRKDGLAARALSPEGVVLDEAFARPRSHRRP